MSAETADGKEVRFVSLRCQAVGKIVPLVECGVPVVDVHRFAFSSRESEDHHIREDLSGLATVTGPVEKRKRRSFRFPRARGKTCAAPVPDIKRSAEKTEPRGDSGKPRLIPGLRKTAADGGDLLPRPGDGGGRNLPEGPATQNVPPARIAEPDAAGTESGSFSEQPEMAAASRSIAVQRTGLFPVLPFTTPSSVCLRIAAARERQRQLPHKIEADVRLTNPSRGSTPRCGRGCCACRPR